MPIAAETPPNAPPSAQMVSATEAIESPPKPPEIPSAFEMLPPVDEVAAAFPQTPTLRLSLFDAIETGLLQNPDLTAARQAEGVSFGALGVARTYPFNPFLQITATPIQQRTDGQDTVVYHYVLVMQTLQLAHQQRYREEIGMAALTSVRWNILQLELNNIAQTERLYFTATYLRGVRDLMVANAELNEQLLSVSEKQLAAARSGRDASSGASCRGELPDGAPRPASPTQHPAFDADRCRRRSDADRMAVGDARAIARSQMSERADSRFSRWRATRGERPRRGAARRAGGAR
jgi:hypothetical protein